MAEIWGPGTRNRPWPLVHPHPILQVPPVVTISKEIVPYEPPQLETYWGGLKVLILTSWTKNQRGPFSVRMVGLPKGVELARPAGVLQGAARPDQGQFHWTFSGKIVSGARKWLRPRPGGIVKLNGEPSGQNGKPSRKMCAKDHGKNGSGIELLVTSIWLAQLPVFSPTLSLPLCMHSVQQGQEENGSRVAIRYGGSPNQMPIFILALSLEAID